MYVFSQCDTFRTFLEAKRTDYDASCGSGVNDTIRQTPDLFLILF